ncbi:hypothetical protein AB0J38_32075 [Streptomyces sp. NPDC050095]|uniref:hypothetical protein n=1 Tax=unclassified Streptomyces TaxID=2593676 RepID=UPI00343853EE
MSGRWFADWLRGDDDDRRGSRRPRGISPTGDKPWLRADPVDACPVPERQRKWIEWGLRWCAREFGPATDPLRTVAMPGFAPSDFTCTQAEAEALVRRIGAVMGADITAISLVLLDPPPGPAPTKRHTVGTYRKTAEGAEISLNRSVADRPDAFAALVAHEVAHARLIGERHVENRTFGPGEEEDLTDLATVHLGMGVLTANAADSYVKATGYSVTALGELTDWMLTGRRDEPPHHMGYLSPQEFGYALACWSELRGDTAPGWARHLAASVRDAFAQGLAYRASRPR